MGMLQNGRWVEEDAITTDGAYVRRPSVHAGPVPGEVIGALAAEPGRFHLVASESCPWSHRALLVRRLKGLEALVPVHIAWGPRVEGYAIAGGASRTVPGTHRRIRHLHELYTLDDPVYTGRSTVPVLWDSRERRIVSNESSVILRAFDAVRRPEITPDFTLAPPARLPDIDAVNADIYENLSNGVYRAHFAGSQAAYDEAVDDVFRTMDTLDARLAERRYLLGNTITEADWRLFPTLFRFDAIYHVLHRCTRRRLVDYPNLWAYARDLYAWRGIAGVVTLDAMRRAGYRAEANGSRNAVADAIVAAAPDADWGTPHGRDVLGPARIALRDGGEIDVEPRAFGA